MRKYLRRLAKANMKKDGYHKMFRKYADAAGIKSSFARYWREHI